MNRRLVIGQHMNNNAKKDSFYTSKRGSVLAGNLISVALLAILVAGGMGLFNEQLKINSFIEFQRKREQLRLALLGQVLINPANCKCLLANGVLSGSGGVFSVEGFTQPQQIGPYISDSCNSGLSDVLVSDEGVDGLKLVSTQLRDITNQFGTYTGTLTLELAYAKKATGPERLSLVIPVVVNVETSGVPTFNGCGNTGSYSGSASYDGFSFTVNCRHFASCPTLAKKICDQMYPGANCLTQLYTTWVDGGKRNVPETGYSCKPRLCGP